MQVYVLPSRVTSFSSNWFQLQFMPQFLKRFFKCGALIPPPHDPERNPDATHNIAHFFGRVASLREGGEDRFCEVASTIPSMPLITYVRLIP